MEGAATPDFPWAVLMQGHQRKAVMDTYSAIRTAQLGKHKKSIFLGGGGGGLSHNLQAAQRPYREHPCSPASHTRIHSLDVHWGLDLLFQFLGKMDYFLRRFRYPCISAATAIWQIWMYMFIFMGVDIKWVGAGGGLSQHFAGPWHLLYL